jgi:hypothetical protein
MKDFLERLLNGRYVGLLEGEVSRLRAENRALTNSLLGTAGFPPVDFPAAAKPQEIPRETNATRDGDVERNIAAATFHS